MDRGLVVFSGASSFAAIVGIDQSTFRYTPAQELTLFLIVLVVAAIPALFTWWKLH
jgi:hypothetical protein